MSSADPIVILAARRTPIGGFQGALSALASPKLGAAAIRAAVADSGVPADQIDEVYMGCCLMAGLGQAPARQAALGAGLVLSTQASLPLEHVAQAVLSDPGRGPLWFQLYLQHDRGFTQALVQRAEAAGYEALVLTVDAPTSGIRDRERRAHFHLPPGIGPVNLAGLQPAPTPALQPGQSALFDGLLHQAPTWDDIAWLKSITRLPVLLKGVLHPADAVQAMAVGADGIIVSNHGGQIGRAHV